MCFGLKNIGNYFHWRDNSRDKEKRVPSLYEQGKLFIGGIENSEAFNVFFTFLNSNEDSKTPKDKRRECHTLMKNSLFRGYSSKLAVFVFEVAHGCAYAPRQKDYHDRVSY